MTSPVFLIRLSRQLSVTGHALIKQRFFSGKKREPFRVHNDDDDDDVYDDNGLVLPFLSVSEISRDLEYSRYTRAQTELTIMPTQNKKTDFTLT